MTIVGYARTSTTDQIAGLDDQVAQLEAAGCSRVYSEHVSALATVRPQLVACLAWLREGDTLIVTKPDRLARSVPALLKLVDELAAREVSLRILSMDINTSTSTGKLVLTVLGAIAAWEREIMLERQLAGIAKAHADGKYQGRKPWATNRGAEVFALIDAGQTRQATADALGMSLASVYRVLRQRPQTTKLGA